MLKTENLKVDWLLEEFVHERTIDLLEESIKRQGMTAKRIKIISYLEDLKAFYPEDACVVFHGSVQGSRFVQKAPWIPGAYFNATQYECKYYYAFLGPYLLNQDYAMMPFAEFHRRREWLLEHLGSNNCLFVRPSTGFKIFGGQIVTGEKWDSDVRDLSFYDVSPEALVVVCTPINIHREWRTFVVDKKVITGSLYKTKDQLTIEKGLPKEVVDFAQSAVDFAKEFEPDKCWTLDLCETESGLSVLEIGAFSACGLYAADTDLLVEAVTEAAKKEYKDIWS